MSTNLREAPIDAFSAQPWLLPKRNAGGVLLPLEASQDQITAEWGNRVDASLREANEAFNGLPINASNVGGRLRGAARGTQAEGGTLRLELFGGLAEGHWIHVEATAYGASAEGEYLVVLEHAALLRRQGDQVAVQAVLVDTTLHAEDEDAEARCQILGEAPDGVAAQLTLVVSAEIDWAVDFTVRAVPGPLASLGLASPESPVILQPPASLAVPAVAEASPPVHDSADLPAGGDRGQVVWVSDARKQGEKPKQGTGVLAYWDGEGWRRLRDDRPVTT